MPSRRVTFILPFDDSDEEDGYDSDFENIYKPKEEAELNLNKEILLFKNNILDFNFKLKEGTSFINIKEYLIEIVFIKPLKLLFAKILILISDHLIPASKSRALFNNRTKIQALTLL